MSCMLDISRRAENDLTADTKIRQSNNHNLEEKVHLLSGRLLRLPSRPAGMSNELASQTAQTQPGQ